MTRPGPSSLIGPGRPGGAWYQARTTGIGPPGSAAEPEGGPGAAPSPPARSSTSSPRAEDLLPEEGRSDRQPADRPVHQPVRRPAAGHRRAGTGLRRPLHRRTPLRPVGWQDVRGAEYRLAGRPRQRGARRPGPKRVPRRDAARPPAQRLRVRKDGTGRAHRRGRVVHRGRCDAPAEPLQFRASGSRQTLRKSSSPSRHSRPKNGSLPPHRHRHPSPWPPRPTSQRPCRKVSGKAPTAPGAVVLDEWRRASSDRGPPHGDRAALRSGRRGERAPDRLRVLSCWPARCGGRLRTCRCRHR